MDKIGQYYSWFSYEELFNRKKEHGGTWTTLQEKDLKETYDKAESVDDFFHKIGYKSERPHNKRIGLLIEEKYDWFSYDELSARKHYPTGKWTRFSEEQLKQFYDESKTQADFFVKLGYTRRKSYSHEMEAITKVYPWVKFTNVKDITNQRFGRLVALTQVNVPNKKRQRSYWHCKCDCGNYIDVSEDRLASGNTKSCGCLKHDLQIERNKATKKKDYTGEQCGHLIALYPTEERTSNGHVKWVCFCRACNSVTQPIDFCAYKIKKRVDCGCLLSRKSKSEVEISQILSNNNILFKEQYAFEDLKDKRELRFDFAIFNEDNSLRCLIEYNGEQHYKPVSIFGGEKQFEEQKIRDRMKVEYCKQEGIKLFVIPYDQTITEDLILNLIKED